jgi:hypothetical protein
MRSDIGSLKIIPSSHAKLSNPIFSSHAHQQIVFFLSFNLMSGLFLNTLNERLFLLLHCHHSFIITFNLFSGQLHSLNVQPSLPLLLPLPHSLILGNLLRNIRSKLRWRRLPLRIWMGSCIIPSVLSSIILLCNFDNLDIPSLRVLHFIYKHFPFLFFLFEEQQLGLLLL